MFLLNRYYIKDKLIFIYQKTLKKSVLIGGIEKPQSICVKIVNKTICKDPKFILQSYQYNISGDEQFIEDIKDIKFLDLAIQRHQDDSIQTLRFRIEKFILINRDLILMIEVTLKKFVNF